MSSSSSAAAVATVQGGVDDGVATSSPGLSRRVGKEDANPPQQRPTSSVSSPKAARSRIETGSGTLGGYGSDESDGDAWVDAENDNAPPLDVSGRPSADPLAGTIVAALVSDADHGRRTTSESNEWSAQGTATGTGTDGFSDDHHHQRGGRRDGGSNDNDENDRDRGGAFSRRSRARTGSSASVYSYDGSGSTSTGTTDRTATTSSTLGGGRGSSNRAAASGGYVSKGSRSVITTAPLRDEGRGSTLLFHLIQSSHLSGKGTEEDIYPNLRRGNHIYRGRTLCCFTTDHIPRQIAISLVESQWFDRAILLLVWVHALLLSSSHNLSRNTLLGFQTALVMCYTVEMLIRFTARGAILRPDAYLRSPWHFFEVILIVAGWATVATEHRVLYGLQMLVLSRVVKRVRGMRILVEAFAAAFSGLVRVLVVMFLFGCIFLVAGLNMWGGVLRARCVSEATGNLSDRTCNPDFDNTGWGQGCMVGYTCVDIDVNPNFGLTSFDNFLYGALLVFRVFTFDQWSLPMIWISDAWSRFAIIWFVFLTAAAAIFGLNFILVILYDHYADANFDTTGDLSESDSDGPSIYDAPRKRAAAIQVGLDDEPSYSDEWSSTGVSNMMSALRRRLPFASTDSTDNKEELLPPAAPISSRMDSTSADTTTFSTFDAGYSLGRTASSTDDGETTASTLSYRGSGRGGGGGGSGDGKSSDGKSSDGKSSDGSLGGGVGPFDGDSYRGGGSGGLSGAYGGSSSGSGGAASDRASKLWSRRRASVNHGFSEVSAPMESIFRPIREPSGSSLYCSLDDDAGDSPGRSGPGAGGSAYSGGGGYSQAYSAAAYSRVYSVVGSDSDAAGGSSSSSSAGNSAAGSGSVSSSVDVPLSSSSAAAAASPVSSSSGGSSSAADASDSTLSAEASSAETSSAVVASTPGSPGLAPSRISSGDVSLIDSEQQEEEVATSGAYTAEASGAVSGGSHGGSASSSTPASLHRTTFLEKKAIMVAATPVRKPGQPPKRKRRRGKRKKDRRPRVVVVSEAEQAEAVTSAGSVASTGSVASAGPIDEVIEEPSTDHAVAAAILDFDSIDSDDMSFADGNGGDDQGSGEMSSASSSLGGAGDEEDGDRSGAKSGGVPVSSTVAAAPGVKLREHPLLFVVSRLGHFFANEKALADHYLLDKPACFAKTNEFIDSVGVEIILDLLIVAHLSVLATLAADVSASYRDAVNVINIVVLCLFSAEMLVKIVSFGILAYLARIWHLLDLGVNVTGVVEAVVFLSGAWPDSRVWGAFASLRALRLIRFARRNKYTFKSIVAMRRSLRPALFNVSLLVIFLFIFSTMGVFWFAPYEDDVSQALVFDGKSFGKVISFRDFGASFISVFIMFTGAGWSDVAYEAMRRDVTLGGIFATSAVIVGRFIIFNFFVCILLHSWATTKITRRPKADRVGLVKYQARRDTKIKKIHERRPAMSATLDPSRPAHLQQETLRGDGWIGSFVINPTFEAIVDLIIVTSSVPLLLDFPTFIANNPERLNVLDAVTIVVTSLYGLEIVLRTVAYGTRRLLADGYFLLDLVVVVASVLGLSLGGVWRFLIVVRAVRLLRVIARLRAVRVMLYSLRKTVWRLMVGPFIVLILFWFIFSIIGMRLFSGTLSYCEGDPTILSRLDCENAIGPNGTIRALAWVQPPIHFDSFGAASLSMFQVTALADWTTVLFMGISSVGTDMAPVPQAHFGPSLFFFVFITIQVFLVVPLFVCVVVDTFFEVSVHLPGSMYSKHKYRNQKLSSHLLASTATRRLFMVYGERTGRVRQWLYAQFVGGRVTKVMMVVIFLNILALFFSHRTEVDSDGWILFHRISNTLFMICYTLEFAAKAYVEGTSYAAGLFNIFQMLLVVLGWIDLIVDWSTEWGSHVAIGFRIFRLLRVFRLIGESTTLYFLSLTFWYALKPCFYASLPIALFMAMFSQMSVHWFGDFETFDDLRFSFASYTAAQLVIYRLFTGDGWFEIMRTLGEQCVYPRCAESWGPPLLYIVQFVGVFALLPIYTSIIFDIYGEVVKYARADRRLGVLREFRLQWETKDESGEGFIGIKDLVDIFHSLSDPFRVDNDENLHLLELHPIPVTDNFHVKFLQTFMPFAEIVLQQDLDFEGLPYRITEKNYEFVTLLRSKNHDFVHYNAKDHMFETDTNLAENKDYGTGLNNPDMAKVDDMMRSLPFKLPVAALWEDWDKDRNGVMDYEEVTAVLTEMNLALSDTALKHAFRKYSSNSVLNFDQFLLFLGDLVVRQELHPVFESYATLKSGLTIAEFLKFALDQQSETLTIADCKRLFKLHNGRKVRRKVLSFGGFQRFIGSLENDLFDPAARAGIYQDMGLPLSHYYIASSHNTYLKGDQLRSDSKAERYKDVLLTGCRCVEIDCWDGEKAPMVYHGHTLTSKVPLREVLEVIKVYAFAASPYPVIISIENHCSVEQQDKMADLLVEILGSLMPSAREIRALRVLPSPQALVRRILIKSKVPEAAMDDTGDSANDGYDASAELPSELSGEATDDDEFSAMVFKDEVDAAGDASLEVTDLDPTQLEAIKAASQTAKEVSEKFKHLIHLRSAKAIDIFTPVVAMASFQERKIIKKIRTDAAEVLAYTNHHLCRVYPHGKRVYSSNLNPVDAWLGGCQLVALNYQTTDVPTLINAGLFRDNGGCGYVLKPQVLTNAAYQLRLLQADRSLLSKCSSRFCGQTVVSPSTESRELLRVHVLSGWRLPKLDIDEDGRESAIVNPFVRVGIQGLPEYRREFRTSVIANNGFHPEWDQEFEFEVAYRDVAILYFIVMADTGRQTVFLGYSAVPLAHIREGFRSVSLFKKDHSPLEDASLLVEVDFQAIGGDRH